MPCRNWRGSILSALDFAETRSQGDAKLLGTARSKQKGERLSDEEAKALRRKVGGTASESSPQTSLEQCSGQEEFPESQQGSSMNTTLSLNCWPCWAIQQLQLHCTW